MKKGTENTYSAADKSKEMSGVDTAYSGESSLGGKGLYYLWHLQVVGLLDANSPDPESKLTGKDVKVAIIDNGCARYHPNLPKYAIIDRADFAYDWSGLAFEPWSFTQPTPPPIDLDKDLNLRREDVLAVAPDKLEKIALERLDLAVKNVNSSLPKEEGILQDPSARFSNHGTSCAGLIAGRPQEEPENDQCQHEVTDNTTLNPWAIPYYGVNRQARIIPINTPYNHEYVPLTLALLHAVRFGAEVVLIPRAAMDPSLEPDITKDDPRYTRFVDSPELQADKLIFELVLKKISAKIPVVVAAGNDGGDVLQYPASLVANGCPDLIVVGACNARGFRSSYSMGGHRTSATGVTVYAPSDDAEELSKTYMRYNEAWWRGRQLKLELGAHQGNPDGAPVEKSNCYSPYGVLAIDIPGTFGRGGLAHEDELEYDDPGQVTNYGSSSKPGEEPEGYEHKPGSLYSVFGGTSAAASIVAGIVSLKVDGFAEPKGKNAKAFLLQKVVPSSAAPGIDKKTEAKGRDKVNVIDGSQYL